MKVALFTPYFLPTIGGSELYVYDLALFLKDRGHEVTVFTTNMSTRGGEWPSHISVKRFRVIEESRKLIRPFISMYIPVENIIHKINPNNYDILHFHNLTDLTFPAFLSYTKKPKILTCHTIYGIKHYHYIMGPRLFFFRKILNRMDVLHVLSHKHIKILNEFGLDNKEIVVIPPGVRTTNFYASTNRNGNTILFVGRISPEKGLETLLKALSTIDLDFKLQIIGPIQGSSYFSSLKDRFNDMFVKGKIEYLGSLPRRMLPDRYARADLFVLPSKMESFPLVLLEAMASSLPVISTNVGVAEELIKDWRNGFIVPVGDWKLMAERIKLIIEDKNLRVKMGQYNRKLIEREYDLYKNFGKILSLYQVISC